MGTNVKKLHHGLKAPSSTLEYLYYLAVCYAMLGGIWGIGISLVAPGLLAGLAVLCVMHFGQSVMVAFRPVVFALSCAIVTVLLQLVVHAETFSNDNVRAFVTWLFLLLIIQSLSWQSKFLHRFAIVAFLIGCATLPYLKIYVDNSDVVRLGLEAGIGLSNPNSFSMWFGFCTVYFLVAGLEANHNIIRAASWSAGLLCLYLVAITVSRGPLLGVAVAVLFAFRKMLKRSFFPILGLLFTIWLVYVSGVFDNLISYYMARGTEESGRTYLWSKGSQLFMDSWFLGVGMSNAVITRPEAGGLTAGPHNGLLFIGLSSGIIPFAFFIGYMVRAACGAFRSTTAARPNSPFLLPMFVFAFLEMMILDTAFMSPWFMVVISMILSEKGVPSEKAILLARRMKTSQILRC